MSREAEKLSTKLTALPGLDRDSLLAQFEKLYGRAAPLRLSNAILGLAIAYRLQEKVHGSLKPAVRRHLTTVNGRSLPRPVSSGTVLIREWHGHRHTVVVHSDRVEYDGQRFRSLTEVARRITGQKRSGPLFFGLRGAGRGC